MRLTFDGMAPEDICRAVTRELGLGGGELPRLTKAGLVSTCLALAETLARAFLQIQALSGGTPCAGAVTVTDADAYDRLVFQARRDCTDSNMRPSSDAHRGGSGARRKGAKKERAEAEAADRGEAANDTDTDPEGMPEGLTPEEAERWSADAALHDPDKGLRGESDRRAGKQPGAKGHGIRFPEGAETEQLAYAVPVRCRLCPGLASCARVAEASHRKTFIEFRAEAVLHPFRVLDPVCCPMGLDGDDDATDPTDAADATDAAGATDADATDVTEPTVAPDPTDATDATDAADAADVAVTDDGADPDDGADSTDDTGDVPEGYTLVTAEEAGLDPEGERLEGGDPTMGGYVFERPQGTTMYGPAVRALVVCQTCVAMCAVERTHDVVSPMLGLSLSTGTIFNMVMAFSAIVAPVVAQVMRVLREGGGVVCCDETGVDVGGTNCWVHEACDELYTFLSVQRKRGREGLDAAGFLALFAGIAVHDCWASYWCFDDVTHALCDEHLLRELVALRKYFRGCRVWALRMSDLMLLMKETRDEYEAAGHGRVPDNVRDALRWLYERILDEAVAEIPPPPEREPGKRGRPKRGKALSLVDRMRDHEDEFLLFLDDFRVPFTNNLAERTFRLVGAKKHVSGCFRTMEGAVAFVTIWSFLSTARKHGHSYWEAALAASRGHAMELIFPDGVEAAIDELRGQSEGLPLKPAKKEKAEDAA